MADEKRKTGIGIVGDVPWGTHFCQFYKTPDDLLSILVPYFKAGLENNEYCMWVTSDPLNADDAMKALKTEVKDLDVYIKKGQIEILDYSAWYTKTGTFDADLVLKGWVEREQNAIKKGFDGIRLTGNTSWLERKDWKKFADYEMAINDTIHKYKMLVVCTYSLDKCDASDIIDVVSSHEFALIRKGSTWERIESYELKLKREALHLNEVLRVMNVINQMAVGEGDQEKLLTKACNAILQARGYCMAWIGTVEEGSKRVVPIACAGEHTDYLDKIVVTWDDSPTGCGPTGTAIKTRQPSVCRNIATDPKLAPWRKEALQRGFASSAVIPMMHGGRVFGAITVYAKTPEYFSDEEVALLVDLGNDIAFAICNIELQKLSYKAEKSMRESEENFRNLANAVPQIVWTTLPDGRNNYFNQRWMDYTGMTLEESYGHGWNAPFHPDDKLRAWDAWQRATQNDEVYSVECRLRRFDGVYRWWLIRGEPLRDEKGAILKWFGTCTDIEDLKKTELEREEFFKFFQISPDIMVIADPNGCFKKVNPSCLQILGYSESELLAKPFIDFVHPDDQQPTRDEMSRQMKLGSSLDFENRYICKNGTVRWMSWRASYDKDKGITYATARDITERKHAEREIRESEKYFRTIFDTATDGILIADVENKKFSMGNHAICKQLGYTQDEIKELGLEDIHPAKDLPYVADQFEMQAKGKFSLAENIPMKRKDGTVFYADVNSNVITISCKKFLLGFFRDITERKKAEEALIEQSKLFDAFFENSIVSLVFLDRNFNFIRVNKAYAKVCQRDVADFPGHNHFEFYPSDAKAIFERVVETKEPFQVNARPFVFPDHPALGVTYWDWILAPILDKKGEVEYLIFLLNDVTERVNVDSELRSSSLYARNLIEASLDPLVTISSDGKISDVNKATEHVTGVPREQLIGQDFVNYFTDPQKARDGYKQVFSQGIVKDYPLTIRHASGYTTEVLYNASLYKNEAGEVQGVFAAARDVTELKRAEKMQNEALIRRVKAEKMDEMKNLFIASMSHELRTPLNSIIGFTGILLMGLSGELNDEQKKQLGMIKNSSYHLLELINDVIDVSKIEAGMVNFLSEEFELEALMIEARDSVINSIKDKGLEFALDFPVGLIMQGDRRRMKQIIINLLSNAVKFTDRGKITVEAIKVGDKIRVNVTDTGIGIRSDDIGKLFQQFSRIVTPGRLIQEGAGLGLYLSQKIAGMLGGEITVQSEFEKGSVFTLELPLEKQAGGFYA